MRPSCRISIILIMFSLYTNKIQETLHKFLYFHWYGKLKNYSFQCQFIVPRNLWANTSNTPCIIFNILRLFYSLLVNYTTVRIWRWNYSTKLIKYYYQIQWGLLLSFIGIYMFAVVQYKASHHQSNIRRQ